jgi:DNA repair protein SbcC/Rad50
MRRTMMILTRLHLENFKRYVTYDIEFGQGLIGIIGKNGSGKSTIFEAILFALYGEFKNRGEKELVRNANATTKDVVVVELIFEFEAVEYRVLREFRGKALSANAKLYKNEELTDSGAREVTTAITNLTKMSKDAFMHTLFASQKELTSLSTLKNEDRKKMIRRLLGLERIDFIEKELIEKSRQLKREIQSFGEVLQSEDEIKLKEKQIKSNKLVKEALNKEVLSKSEELEHIKTREQTIKKELVELSKIKELKQKAFSELELLQNTKSSEIMNQVKLSAELHELEHKQEALEKMGNIKVQFASLQEQLKAQEKLKEIFLKKEGILKEQVSLSEQWKKSKADVQALEKECEMHGQYTFDLKNLEQDISIRQDEIEVKHTIEQELLLEMAAEQKIIDVTNAKIQKVQGLGREGACPTCTRPLLEEYDKVVDSLNEIVQSTHQKKINKYKTQLENVRKQKSLLEAAKKLKDKEFAELTKKLNIIQSKLLDLKKEREHLKTVEQKGLKNKAELKELETYVYDEKIHIGVVKGIEEMEPNYKHALTLETELKREPLIKADLVKVTIKIEQLTLLHKHKEEEFQLIVYDDVKHKHMLEEHEGILKTIDTKTTLLNETKVQIARMDGEIRTIQSSLDDNSTQLKKVQTKKENLKDYEKIKLSLVEFKTKLNAKVAPRISATASIMYSQITKGKYQHIEVNNDFDFFIYDDGKKYPIERFSGGEVDLANLVLRIAISKTLTELSGASSIGFLAFDEVFGSQDEARRMEILEAFNTIKEQYRQIFLISHEMEIKEMFERVVEL